MDLNELLARHQIALIGADHAPDLPARAEASADARAFADRIEACQPGLIAATD